MSAQNGGYEEALYYQAHYGGNLRQNNGYWIVDNTATQPGSSRKGSVCPILLYGEGYGQRITTNATPATTTNSQKHSVAQNVVDNVNAFNAGIAHATGMFGKGIEDTGTHVGKGAGNALAETGKGATKALAPTLVLVVAGAVVLLLVLSRPGATSSIKATGSAVHG